MDVGRLVRIYLSILNETTNGMVAIFFSFCHVESCGSPRESLALASELHVEQDGNDVKHICAADDIELSE